MASCVSNATDGSVECKFCKVEPFSRAFIQTLTLFAMEGGRMVGFKNPGRLIGEYLYMQGFENSIE